VRFSELDRAAIGVWGAGREIRSFAAQLARRLPGARIVAVAFDAPPAEDVRVELSAPHAQIVTGSEIVPALSKCDVVVRSPGVSVYRPELVELRAAGVPVSTATSLWLAEHGPDGVLGVTGTKGKSTTAALAHHLASAAGVSARLAGNIGVPALDLLDAPDAQVTVLELSSYHIADLQTGTQVALVTNLFREHTEWHGSEGAYRADKLRLLGLPGVRAAVLNGRDRGLADTIGRFDTDSATVASRSRPRAVDDLLDYAVEPIIYGSRGGWDVCDGGVAFGGELLASAEELPLRGEHNALNLCGALAALGALGIAPQLPEALDGFEALAHRLQPVAERDGVLWVDDSISTTPESTLAALGSFPGRELVLIAGGQDRGQDYSELARVLAAGAGPGGVSLVGVPTTGERLIAAARQAGVPGERAVLAPDLAGAVELARGLASAGAVVLLSPAAPSFDQYRDFEQRGERFAELVG
jgi:UDP-N-acetylmuramoyl-L-alanine---L-glutamate ligase